MRPDDFDIQTIIDDLNGQCMMSLNDAIEQNYPGMTEDDLTSDDHWEIDNAIFNCATCNWWCGTDEAHPGDQGDVCDDCNEADEEE